MNIRYPRVAVFVETSTGYGRRIFRGIADYLRVHEPWTLRHAEPSPTAVSKDELRTCDGVIAMANTGKVAETLGECAIPIVNVSGRQGGLAFPSVLPDDDAVGVMAARHLLDLGFERFGFYGMADHHASNRRRTGFIRTIEQAGYQCHRREPPSSASWEELHEGGMAWLNTFDWPCGVMSFADRWASELFAVAAEMELPIPEKLAVVGVDDDELLCETMMPALSSVDSNATQIGFLAAQMLDRLMRREAVADQHLTVEPRQVVGRASTDVVAIHDDAVARAVRFMHANAAEPINVEDVVPISGVSRRSLERRFRMALGRTPRQHLQVVKVDRAKKLLAETDWSMARVASSCGIEHAEHLSRFFRRETGQSPSEYRRRFRKT